MRAHTASARAVQSTSWGLGSWFPLVLVLCFNVGDLVGKSLPARVRLVRRGALPCCTLLHAGYVLLFLLLLRPALLPEALRGDALPVLLVLSFGLSTGYLGTTGLVLAAERETSRKERERAGVISSPGGLRGRPTGGRTVSKRGRLLASTSRVSSPLVRWLTSAPLSSRTDDIGGMTCSESRVISGTLGYSRVISGTLGGMTCSCASPSAATTTLPPPPSGSSSNKTRIGPAPACGGHGARSEAGGVQLGGSLPHSR